MESCGGKNPRRTVEHEIIKWVMCVWPMDSGPGVCSSKYTLSEAASPFSAKVNSHSWSYDHKQTGHRQGSLTAGVQICTSNTTAAVHPGKHRVHSAPLKQPSPSFPIDSRVRLRLSHPSLVNNHMSPRALRVYDWRNIWFSDEGPLLGGADLVAAAVDLVIDWWGGARRWSDEAQIKCYWWGNSAGAIKLAAGRSPSKAG